MNNLRSQLDALANNFVSGLLAAMNAGLLGELADGTAPRSSGAAIANSRGAVLPNPSPGIGASRTPPNIGRRKRSSATEVEEQRRRALVAAKALKGGFSKGDVMRKSGSKVDLGRALFLLVSDGELTKKGDRRNTRYWVK